MTTTIHADNLGQDRFFARLANIPGGFIRRMKHTRTLGRLETLDDRMLKDIGLTRGDLADFRARREGFCFDEI